MARIPEEEIERLKREVSLERLVEEKGIELARHGADLIGLCPFHDDHEPSLVITPAKNLWHCLGACQKGGSVIDWVMKTEGVSFRHAVEVLRAGAPLSTGRPLKFGSIKKLASPVDADADDQALMAQVIGYYHETLKKTPDALAYLESRRLQSAELIEHFRVGFSNRTLAYRLPDKNRAAGAKVRGRMQALGIYRETGHEHFNGSIVVPITDEQGSVVEMYGRKIGHLKQQTYHLYLPGPHKGVWNIEALQASQEIILCEALFDAMTFWAAGFRHVTASYGIEGFTVDHIEAFRRYNTKRVLIAYDRDDAGDRAAKVLADQLTAEGIECFRIVFPHDTDANSFVRSADNLTDALGRVIRNATWIGAGKPMKLRQATPVEATAEQEVIPDEAPADVSSLVATSQVVSPLPLFQGVEIPVTFSGDELHLVLGDRRWRVRGVSKVTSFDLMKVNIFVARVNPSGAVGEFHIDTLDLYSARARAGFTKAAAEELKVEEEVIKTDLGRVLLSCERAADEAMQKALEPADRTVFLSDEERAAAMELLTDPGLFDRILKDFTSCGVVGEETNKLVGYLTAVSRKLDQPLAVIIQSSSAAGKSSLMESVLSMIPEEDRVKFSAMTGQSLFYMGESDLAHKVLAIVEGEGAERAAYALKLLQSEGELSIASTGKDPATGKLVTHTYKVKGPVAIFLTTTAIDVDEELLSRCIMLSVNEEREQTQAIHALQRRRQTLAGLLQGQDKSTLLKVHQDAQRLLKPMLVANPFAERLTFTDGRTRARRDHMKYLTLIRSIALLHQHQREIKTATHDGKQVSYIEVERADITLANRLAHEILGRSLDELPPQTRRLLEVIDAMVAAHCQKRSIERTHYRFTRRQLRESCGWGDTQLKLHLHRLVELEYLLVHQGGRGHSFVYELVWDGQGSDGKPYLPGLIDLDALDDHAYDPKRSGQNGDRSGSGRPLVGVWLGGGRNGSEPEDSQVIPKEKTSKAVETQKSTTKDNPSTPAPLVTVGKPSP